MEFTEQSNRVRIPIIGPGVYQITGYSVIGVSGFCPERLTDQRMNAEVIPWSTRSKVFLFPADN